jgi:tRNA modification GTPase
VFIARPRRMQALRRCAAHHESARAMAKPAVAEFDLLAEGLRLVHDALGEITGRMSADAQLREIFGRFCISK